jgi:hypothetical protein
MNEREKYRAEIESRLTRLDESVVELATKAELRDDLKPSIDIEGIVENHKTAKEKLGVMDDLADSDWHAARVEVDTLVDRIDADLRNAMAYFS